MGQKVFKAKVKRAKGFLYYIDKKGNVARVKMARGGKGGGKPQVLVKSKIKRAPGYLYFIDKQGDISRAKMARGGRRKKKGKGKKRRLLLLRLDLFPLQYCRFLLLDLLYRVH